MIDLVLSVCGFAAGVVTATVVVVRIGSQMEDRAATLRSAAPSRIAGAARWITGLYVRTPQQTAAQPTEADQPTDGSQTGHVGEACNAPDAGLEEVRP